MPYQSSEVLKDKTILITGGTGTFGKAFAKKIFPMNPKKVIIYSRDEFKQSNMREEFKEHDDVMRYFIGDVRDKSRLEIALRNVDYIVHAAALKQVPSIEYNPSEAVNTNIIGAMNIIESAIKCGVQKIIALSTDKAVYPINLYGMTKGCSDKLFLSANAYTGSTDTKISLVRYGNVSGSRGSIIPYIRGLIDKGVTEFPLTDIRMTRFWMDINDATELVLKALIEMNGVEIFVSKLRSYYVNDLLIAMAKLCGKSETIKTVGIRDGEKLHEYMISRYDRTYDHGDHFIIYPKYEWHTDNIKPGGTHLIDFEFTSETADKMSVNELIEKVRLL